MPTKLVQGLRLEITYYDGSRRFVNYEGFTEESIRRHLKALGGKHYEGVKEVHSIEKHEWIKEYFAVGF